MNIYIKTMFNDKNIRRCVMIDLLYYTFSTHSYLFLSTAAWGQCDHTGEVQLYTQSKPGTARTDRGCQGRQLGS